MNGIAAQQSRPQSDFIARYITRTSVSFMLWRVVQCVLMVTATVIAGVNTVKGCSKCEVVVD